jgi:divalent metal cation (Fe/Co/Zn/Cd) transporter
VALLIFTGGGVFSIYEGLHKIRHPEGIERAWVGYGILGFSLLLEGFATWGNLREMKKRRRSMRLIPYLRATKDSDLVVVFGENLAAVIGLAFALLALLLTRATGDARWDGAGSLCIGVVLVAVAFFLATEVKSLLVGESADPDIAAAVEATIVQFPALGTILAMITVQQGPGEVMVALKVRPHPRQAVDQLIAEINAFERALKLRAPEVVWIFVEPDDHA